MSSQPIENATATSTSNDGPQDTLSDLPAISGAFKRAPCGIWKSARMQTRKSAKFESEQFTSDTKDSLDNSMVTLEEDEIQRTTNTVPATTITTTTTTKEDTALPTGESSRVLTVAASRFATLPARLPVPAVVQAFERAIAAFLPAIQLPPPPPRPAARPILRAGFVTPPQASTTDSPTTHPFLADAFHQRVKGVALANHRNQVLASDNLEVNRYDNHIGDPSVKVLGFVSGLDPSAGPFVMIKGRHTVTLEALHHTAHNSRVHQVSYEKFFNSLTSRIANNVLDVFTQSISATPPYLLILALFTVSQINYNMQVGSAQEKLNHQEWDLIISHLQGSTYVNQELAA